MTVGERPKKPVNWVWRGVSLLIAAALIGVVLWLVEWDALLDVLGRVSPASLIATFFVYVLLNLWRSFRFVALLNRDDLQAWRVFPIALYHNFLVRLLPFKLGEFSYIVLMRQRMNVPVDEGVSSLFGSRLLELLMIVLVAAVSLLLAGDILPIAPVIAWGLVAFCVLGGIAGFYMMGTLIRIFTGIVRRFIQMGFAVKLADRLDNLAEEFDRIRDPKIFARALFWSLFTYGGSFAVNWILLLAVGVDVDIFTLILLVSIGMFATAFPFNISGFGAVELGWTWGLTTLLAYSPAEAVSIGLLLNGYQLICAAIAGAIGYVLLQMYTPKPLVQTTN
ncbi:MAG: lysylphosphatidylglycerol synthase transmembrane domain-containing protein [Chloroflexota bacterium]